MKNINFTEPYLSNLENKHISNVLKKKEFTNDGYYSKKCSLLIRNRLKAKDVLLTNSCTSAIEIALICLDLKPNDEIIIPSYTFVSVADTISKLKIKIVFCDIDENFMINLDDLRNKISTKTKAIILSHNNGNSVDFKKLKKLINKKKIYIIEDAAQALGAKYKKKFLGTLGDFGCFSFHQTKNIHCGNGGALLINNKKFSKIAKIIWNRGTNRTDFLKGNVKKYVWINQGNASHISEIQSAFLYPQLQNILKVNNIRKKIFYKYLKSLSTLRNIINLPKINKFNTSNYHLFYFLLPKSVRRDNLIKFMKEKKIQVTSHYEALHLSPMAKNKLKINYKLPNSKTLSKKIVRLPMHTNLTNSEINYICINIKRFFDDRLFKN
tara:strand:- start:28 stop:1170 length:1143 start_codon:yes stop_codon:yes gene_type:complete